MNMHGDVVNKSINVHRTLTIIYAKDYAVFYGASTKINEA